MVAFSITLLAFFLAHLAATTPVTPAQPSIASTTPVPDGRILECETSSGKLLFRRSELVHNIASFPKSKGASGYPHVFRNHEGFSWDFNTKACDEAPVLFEMPVFPDGRHAL
ncbi:hypothetical protein QBC39DRAFT_385164 [Podospora conica]|nr:hypothetical protein QBC39DRAFT_385164 [Schizothecium conicum]